MTKIKTNRERIWANPYIIQWHFPEHVWKKIIVKAMCEHYKVDPKTLSEAEVKAFLQNGELFLDVTLKGDHNAQG